MYEVGDLQMKFGVLIRRRRDHFAAHSALHVSHFLRALIHQQNDQMSFRMIVGNGFGDFFDKRRLAGLGRGDNQATLPLADRRDQVEHSHRQVRIPGRQLQPFSRIYACELGELGNARILVWVYPVHQFNASELIRLSAATTPAPIVSRTGSSRNLNALPQPEVLDQISRNKDIVWRGQIVALRVTKKAEPFFVYLKNTRSGLLVLHYKNR